MNKNNSAKKIGKQETVGILGKGEIGSAIAQICEEATYRVLIKEINYDQFEGSEIDYLHVNIPDKDQNKFVSLVSFIINQYKPKLTVINASVTPGTTRKIYQKTKLPIIHSPCMGVHPHLYKSIKEDFPKIIGPVNDASLKLAVGHFKNLKLKTIIYDSSENSEAAKLLDLVYYAWNIIFCKWVEEECDKLNLNFEQVYTMQNQIYNNGYKKIIPNVVRPILKPVKGPITGHCTIPDTLLYEKYHKNRFTNFILKEQKKLLSENVDTDKMREDFLKSRFKNKPLSDDK